MAKTKSLYMHTLDQQPAMFQDNHIVFAGREVSRLARSLAQIRDEQAENCRWCYRNAVQHDPNEYGYVRIPLKATR
jgi:hypothetical protein